MAEYGSMFAVSGLAAILFFGGWNGPIPITHWLGLTDADESGACTTSATCWACVNFIVKCVVGVTVMMWVRWTLPRLRIDQVMTTCLKYCMPIAAVMFLGAMLWTVLSCRAALICRSPIYGLVREVANGSWRRPRRQTQRRRLPRPTIARRAVAHRASQRSRGGCVAWITSTGIRSSSCCSPLVACGFAVAVVLTSNIVRMAFYLVLSLAATAGLFFLAGADFVGAMQIDDLRRRHAGAVDLRRDAHRQGPFITMKTRGGEWMLARIVGGSLLAVLLSAAFSVEGLAAGRSGEQPADAQVDGHAIGHGPARRARRSSSNEPDPTLRGGMSGYLLPFEIVSVHLLVVLIGAAYLARPKHERSWRSQLIPRLDC